MFTAKEISEKNLKIAIFLGGDSHEKNISLDSARTFFDSIRKIVRTKDLILVMNKKLFKISSDLIYSNTIEDFKYKIDVHHEIKIERVISGYDVFCPFIHGKFGEDGELTKLLNSNGRYAVLGSPPDALALTLDKFSTSKKLNHNGFPTAKCMRFNINDWKQDSQQIKSELMQQIPFDNNGCFIIKPNDCGSSDGVCLASINNIDQAIKIASRYSSDLLAEEKIEGREFSLIIIQLSNGFIFPLVPTEIKIAKEESQSFSSKIYTRLKKYMPNNGVKHITPMQVCFEVMTKIRSEAIQLFHLMGLSDFARFDGFLTKNNEIIWSDLNGIPGYGQDSFFFQQSAIFGLDIQDISLLLIRNALAKENVFMKKRVNQNDNNKKMKIAVIGGGTTSEKNVSKMSWMNVIFKLNSSNMFEIKNVFQNRKGEYWEVPLFFVLQHTADEIELLIENVDGFSHSMKQIEQIKSDSDIEMYLDFKSVSLPKQLSISDIARKAKFVFIALHGGAGEDGTLQKELTELGVKYNGSGDQISKICMNKYDTNKILTSLNIPKFSGPKQFILEIEYFKNYTLKEYGFSNKNIEILIHESKEVQFSDIKRNKEFQKFSKILNRMIQNFQKQLDSRNGLVFKPINDGCSSGVIVSTNPEIEIPIYLLAVMSDREKIYYYELNESIDENNELFIQMPDKQMTHLLVEQFIGDKNKELNPRFLEMTIGVIESENKMVSLLPSETLSQFNTLSVEEKFCKGVGPNLTPPPSLSEKCVENIRCRIETFANMIGIEGYARIDVKYDTVTDDLFLIEVNTLPGLTSATILYTQALVTPGIQLKPTEFLEKIIEVGSNRKKILSFSFFDNILNSNNYFN